MSYKLIDANNIAFNSDGFITAENIVKMPCIYADLPNGMDGEHYVLEQEPILDKIRTEIYQLHCHPKLDFIKTDEVVDMALDIIDKYK